MDLFTWLRSVVELLSNFDNKSTQRRVGRVAGVAPGWRAGAEQALWYPAAPYSQSGRIVSVSAIPTARLGGFPLHLRLPAGTIGGMGRARRRGALLAWGVLGASLSVLPACGSSSNTAQSVSVFQLKPQDCFNPPKANPNLAVSNVTVLPCGSPHVDEVYCVLPYSSTPPSSVVACPAKPPRFAGSLTQDYPGVQALTTFANAVCLNEFQPFVGTAYTNSSLYYTYLYPSPNSWDNSVRRDRMIVCVLHTTGAPLTGSAKGSKL